MVILRSTGNFLFFLFSIYVIFVIFFSDTDAEIFSSVKKGEFDFPSPDWDDISSQAKHFIRSLLKIDVKQVN